MWSFFKQSWTDGLKCNQVDSVPPEVAMTVYIRLSSLVSDTKGPVCGIERPLMAR